VIQEPDDTDASPRQDDSAENYILRGATFGSRPPMFVIGVTIAAGEDRTPGKGLDRCGMRVMMHDSGVNDASLLLTVVV
jgi:hypothetical protein